MKNWKSLPFPDVIADESGSNQKTLTSDYLSEGAYAVVDQGKNLIAGYVNDESRCCKAVLPVIVFGDHTRCFKYVDFPFCMGADGVKVLRPKVPADVKYLFHFFRQVPLTNGGYDRHFKYLKRCEVLLPPLEEQRRIAEILDRAETLRTQRRVTLARLDALSQSIFLEMFGDPATNPRGWPLKCLKVLGKVTTGGTPPSSKDGMFGGAIPFVTPGDLESGEPPKRTVTAEGAAACEVVRSGATLVCCIGTIGKALMTRVPSAFNQQINAVEWGGEIEDWFGYTALRHLRPQIEARAASTTLLILRKSIFERIELPVPPLALQREFATRVAAVEKLRATHRASLAQFDALFASLQHRAFRGEL